MLINKCGNDYLHADKEIMVLRPLNIVGETACIYIGCTSEKRIEVELPQKAWLALSMVKGNDIKAEAWLAARIHETVTLSANTVERYLRINLRELLEDETQ